jgi:PAS domain S-box-containing protein
MQNDLNSMIILEQLNRELRASENKWRSFVDKSPDGIVITSVDGVFEEINRRTFEIFGYHDIEEVRGKNIFDFLEPTDHERARLLIGDIIKGNHSGAHEFKTIKKDGSPFFVEINTEPFQNRPGEPLSLIHIIRDISERKQSGKTITMLAQAIRSVSECVSITDMADKIIYVNSAFLKTYRYEEEELIGNPISMVRSANNSLELVNEILPATLRGGWHGELLNLKKDGTEFPVYLSTSVIYEENGEPLGLIGVTTDITQRIQAEKELHESEARNKALLSAIPDLMFMFNREGDFTDYHVKDPKLLLLKPELFVGRSVFDVLPPELAEETMLHLQEVFDTGKTSVYDYDIKIGKETWSYESRIVACGNDLALSIVRDITDQKKMESQMIQSERLAALGEMSAGMAHEINQPLNTLSILFDNILLEAREKQAVSEQYLVSKSEKIFNNILRIKNIIDHVREFSRSQENYEFTPFDVNECIQNALSMVSEQYKIAGIELSAEIEKDLPPLNGDSYKFERVLLNLIINSKDALIEKKNRLDAEYQMHIKIASRFDKNEIQVRVEDNGCGIKQEHRNKIFQPFYTTKETGKGTGLGLSISFGLIKEMNGKIEIQSNEGEGTAVLITVPATQAQS